MNPWVGMLALAMSLVLALRAFRSRGLTPRTKIVMALIWAVIIIGAAVAFNGFER